MNPLTLLSLLADERFGVGAGVGAVGAVAILLTGRRLDWFLVWSAASLIGLELTDGLEPVSEAGSWSRGVVGVMVVAVGVSAAPLLRRTGSWVPHLLFALAVLGVWGTVPDTEHARVLMGTTAPLLILASGPRTPASRVPWLLLASAVLGYVILLDGWPRDSAVVGASGAVGMLVAAGAAMGIHGLLTRGSVKASDQPVLNAWLLAGAQVLLVILSGRVAGRASSASAAEALLLVSYLAVTAAWFGAEVWWTRRQAS